MLPARRPSPPALNSRWGLLLLGAWLLSACRVDQAPECRRLLACAQVLVPGAAEELTKVYGKHGSCWEGRAAARRCAQSCREALEGLSSEPAFRATGTCQP